MSPRSCLGHDCGRGARQVFIVQENDNTRAQLVPRGRGKCVCGGDRVGAAAAARLVEGGCPAARLQLRSLRALGELPVERHRVERVEALLVGEEGLGHHRAAERGGERRVPECVRNGIRRLRDDASRLERRKGAAADGAERDGPYCEDLFRRTGFGLCVVGCLLLRPVLLGRRAGRSCGTPSRGLGGYVHGRALRCDANR